MYQVGQLTRDIIRLGIPLLGSFVARTPGNHRRMVAVAANQGRKIGRTPIVEEQRITVRFFGDTPGIRKFVENEESHAVAKFQ